MDETVRNICYKLGTRCGNKDLKAVCRKKAV
jgi:hypothetical protein